MEKNIIVDSFENPEKNYCVDIFMRPDGTFGYEEWRREPEDAGRWFRARYFSAAVFDSAERAVADACRQVAWFDGLHHY